MALDKKEFSPREKYHSTDNYSKMKRDKAFQTKVVVRRLPPSMTEEQFLEQISPLPEHDYFYFVKADLRLGQHAFSRAYINFLVSEDIFIFTDKFDGYVFLDSKGNEYPAIVEFSPFQKIPKKRSKKRDAKCGTIFNDPDYLKFVESLSNPEEVSLPSAEVYLEEIESREKELKANNGVLKMTTPLIEYLKARKIEQQKIREEKREERKRKEIEKKRIREEERRRRKAEKDKERVKEKFKDKDGLSEKEVTEEVDETPAQETVKQPELVVQVLKNPEREKEHLPPPKTKEYFVSSKVSNKEKERNPPKKEWERIRPKERSKIIEKTMYSSSRDKDRSRRDRTDYKGVIGKKADSENSKNTKEVEPKDKEPTKQDPIPSPKDTPASEDEKKSANQSQWSPKDKRDNSCPGNVETGGSRKEETEMSSKTFSNSSKSVTGAEISDNTENLKTDSTESQTKDPRVERRIRNKDRPSLEIYRPGMRRFSTQRSSPQKEISTSASNSSSPSPTPPLAIAKSQAKEGESTTTKSVTSPQ